MMYQAPFISSKSSQQSYEVDTFIICVSRETGPERLSNSPPPTPPKHWLLGLQAAQWQRTCLPVQETRAQPTSSLGRGDPPKKEMQPALVFLPGEFHGQRSPAVYSPWSCKESDMTERLSTHKHKYHLQGKETGGWSWIVGAPCSFVSREKLEELNLSALL